MFNFGIISIDPMPDSWIITMKKHGGDYYFAWSTPRMGALLTSKGEYIYYRDIIMNMPYDHDEAQRYVNRK